MLCIVMNNEDLLLLFDSVASLPESGFAVFWAVREQRQECAANKTEKSTSPPW